MYISIGMESWPLRGVATDVLEVLAARIARHYQLVHTVGVELVVPPPSLVCARVHTHTHTRRRVRGGGFLQRSKSQERIDVLLYWIINDSFNDRCSKWLLNCWRVWWEILGALFGVALLRIICSIKIFSIYDKLSSRWGLACLERCWEAPFDVLLCYKYVCMHSLQHTATHCNTLQLVATHRNTLQYTATHCNTCNTLQHTVPHC